MFHTTSGLTRRRTRLSIASRRATSATTAQTQSSATWTRRRSVPTAAPITATAPSFCTVSTLSGSSAGWSGRTLPTAPRGGRRTTSTSTCCCPRSRARRRRPPRHPPRRPPRRRCHRPCTPPWSTARASSPACSRGPAS
ncbi:hypothetical protein EMIHUDRAFT_457237 [Emiliania huxleyi CCMP1516]|uniref:Uncharacterized protein n=2 Tax=Emiliania huxleyi TaxID=2903 RepID=A0A0D3JU59_EMIH1|nr:hypothetical protein EMIHUDRAFT_457237 [Emiliania huxleyi CCMP1516]EOD27044.1 hypothetical protein EMIHUDRAFT_457237 [Emiliania huxleyi CCMP1516]|eukprot:XP_005779473.1 hypothetical protein EMIHUDRAFT_457237 [Emiliania huxleyi CCMP1516]